MPQFSFSFLKFSRTLYDYMFSTDVMISDTSGIRLSSLQKPKYCTPWADWPEKKLITLKVNDLFHSVAALCDPCGRHAYI